MFHVGAIGLALALGALVLTEDDGPEQKPKRKRKRIKPKKD